MSRAVQWQQPAWFARPAARLRFIAELTATGASVRQVRPRRRYRGGFAIEVIVTPPGVDIRRITIAFPAGSPETVHIHADGPTESPHRYSADELCVWYPFDPPENRWIRSQGAAALLGHIVVHLVKEEWWRRTGEWIGADAPHGPTLNQETA